MTVRVQRSKTACFQRSEVLRCLTISRASLAKVGGGGRLGATDPIHPIGAHSGRAYLDLAFMIASATFRGASAYCLNSIVYVARPCVADRKDVE